MTKDIKELKKLFDMKKQEKIQLEYSVFWEQVKDLVDDFGWIKNSKLHPSNISNFKIKVEWKFDEGGFYARDKWRPKSLINLESNNGWIKIESENDLPNDGSINYYGYWLEFNQLDIYTLNELINYYKSKEITHYQSILKPNNPIY